MFALNRRQPDRGMSRWIISGD